MNIPNTMMRNAISRRVLIVSTGAGAAGAPSMVGDAVFEAITLSLRPAMPDLARGYRALIGSMWSGFGLVFTVVITDMPGRRRFSRATENGTRMRTGTR